jgi:guanylate kinase
MEERSGVPLSLVISAPSGAGKSTLLRTLRARVCDLQYSVSHTTRPLRSGEVQERDYYFVDRARFEHLIAEKAFLEWAHVHGNLYGTSRRELERANGCRALLFDVDYRGACQIRRAVPNAVTVFILPPNLTTLEARLRARASEDEDAVRRRLRAAGDEIAHACFFDHVVVNDDLQGATDRLLGILLAEEGRRRRGPLRAEALREPGLPARRSSLVAVRAS